MGPEDSKMAWPFRRIVRAIWCALVLLLLLGFPILVVLLNKHHAGPHMQAWIYAGIFVVLTIPVTLYEVAMHLEYFTSPSLQKYVIRIHWLVPIYALDSWLALIFLGAEEYINPLRECYEAYTIYSFYSYLVAFLESEVGDLEQYMMLKPGQDHLWPFQLVCQRWVMGRQFLWECKKGILNYVILRPLTAVMGMVAVATNVYKSGKFTPKGVWFWVTVINNISQLWAIYCLVMFYYATRRELEPIRPVPKFILIKAVVFLTFWQSVSISLMISFGWLKPQTFKLYDDKDVGSGLQDFIICVEMFVASLVFAYVFPPKDYMDPMVTTRGFFGNLAHLFDVRDVVEDVSSVVEDRVDRTTVGVADVASSFVHTLGSFFKNPVVFIRERRWQKRNFPVPQASDMNDSLLQLYSTVDWSIPFPQATDGRGPSARGPETELRPKDVPGDKSDESKPERRPQEPQ